MLGSSHWELVTLYGFNRCIRIQERMSKWSKALRFYMVGLLTALQSSSDLLFTTLFRLIIVQIILLWSSGPSPSHSRSIPPRIMSLVSATALDLARISEDAQVVMKSTWSSHIPQIVSWLLTPQPTFSGEIVSYYGKLEEREHLLSSVSKSVLKSAFDDSGLLTQSAHDSYDRRTRLLLLYNPYTIRRICFDFAKRTSALTIAY